MFQKLKGFSPVRMCMSGVLLVLRPLAIPVTLLLHRKVGERFLGFAGLLAVIPFILVTDNFTAPDCGLLTIFMWIYVCRMTWHYLSRGRNHGEGPVLHSRDPGEPLWGLLNKWFIPRGSAYIEAILVTVFGFVFAFVNDLMGGYLFLSGIAMFGVLHLSGRLVRDKVLDRVDAIVEERKQAEEIRVLIGQGDVELTDRESTTAVSAAGRAEHILSSEMRALPSASASS